MCHWYIINEQLTKFAYLSPMIYRDIAAGFIQRLFLKVVFQINNNSNHSHLFNTQMFVSPSSARHYEATLPIDKGNAHIGVPTVKANNNHAIGGTRMKSNVNAGGVSTTKNLINNKLENKDIYTKMKNKAIYGKSSTITAHANLNTL